MATQRRADRTTHLHVARGDAAIIPAASNGRVSAERGLFLRTGQHPRISRTVCVLTRTRVAAAQSPPPHQGAVRRSRSSSVARAEARERPHMASEGRSEPQTTGRSGCPNRRQPRCSSSCTQGTPAGLPCGMPGIADEIDGAMQQAAQPARQSIAASAGATRHGEHPQHDAGGGDRRQAQVHRCGCPVRHRMVEQPLVIACSRHCGRVDPEIGTSGSQKPPSASPPEARVPPAAGHQPHRHATAGQGRRERDLLRQPCGRMPEQYGRSRSVRGDQ